MLLVVLILICCAVFVVWSWIKPGHPSPPVYPGALPLIGHAHLLLGDAEHLWNFEKKLYHFCLKNGGVITMSIGPQIMYVITDLEDSLVVANTCLDKPYIYKFGKEMFGNGLISSNALTWKPHRKLLSPAFNQQVLNTFVHHFNTHARDLVLQLSSGLEKDGFDVQPFLEIHFLKSVYSTSLDIRSHDRNEIVNTYSDAMQNLFHLYGDRLRKFWLHLPYTFNMSSLKKKQDINIKIIKDISNAVIVERKTELKANNSSYDENDAISTEKFKPLLDQMLNLADTEDAFTDVEISEHLDTMVAAAYDTTATAMTLILILIGSHQDVQARIFKELQLVLGDQDRDLNKYDLQKLVYMEAVIKESLRLYPSAPRFGRITHSPVKLKHYVVPANCICLISAYGINRHPVWGADGEQFRPERWLDPATLPVNAFASFSIGKRKCIGKQYAMMTMKTTLAHILKRYRISGDISNVKIRCDVMIKPIKGHHISLELRT